MTPTSAAFCACDAPSCAAYTDERFTVRCALCRLHIRGMVDAWTQRFNPARATAIKITDAR